MSIQRPLLLPALQNLLLLLLPINSLGEKTSSCVNQVSKVSGVKNYRKTLKMEGISSNAAKLISQSRKPGSISGYELAWNKWSSWFYRQKIDPVCASLSEILIYLSTLHEKNLQYWTTNSQCSAVSAYHDYLDGEPVGKHPRCFCFTERCLESKATTA